MPANQEVLPGENSPGQALYLSAAVDTAYLTAERLAHFGNPEQLDLPIQLTSCDTSYTPARCAWKLRAWDTTGQRIDHPNGRTGTVTASPALLIGNGATPPASFPLDTWGRPTRVSDNGSGATIGLPLEVDWNCACAASGSGAGSGGGGTEVVSDCGTYSTIITITLQDVSGTSGLDGMAIDIEWDGSAWVSASTTLLGSTTVWTLACVAGEPSLSFTESGSGTRVTIGGSTGGGTLGGQTIPGFSGTTLGISSDPGVVIGVTLAEG